ncbi:peptidoglycan DD-metalloendopeptidase family protein [bacterium]|nr:peptidoglycan DD-metalloendopeptidase family protein [bacterium]
MSEIKLKKHHILLLAIIGLLSMSFLLLAKISVSAEDTQPIDPNLEAQIKQKIADKQLQAKTLQEEIAGMSGQIKDVEEKLVSIDAEVKLNEQEKNTVLNEIAINEKILEREKIKLKDGIRILYEMGETNPLYVLASGYTVSSAISKEQYVEAVNRDISDSVSKIKTIKEELDKKKKDLEIREAQLTSLKEQQLMISQELSGRIMAKNRLLQETKGDEAAYQNLLVTGLQDKAEVTAVMRSISSGASPTAIGLPYSGPRAGQRVNKGEVIGRMGNTGFSTGPHLHFGVYQSGRDIDPLPMISSGFFIVPAPGAQITQTFDGTYSHRGRGDGWPGGIDFSSAEGTPIRAGREGIILFDGVGRGGIDKGFGHYVIVDHQNGYLSLYAHLR